MIKTQWMVEWQDGPIPSPDENAIILIMWQEEPRIDVEMAVAFHLHKEWMGTGHGLFHGDDPKLEPVLKWAWVRKP